MSKRQCELECSSGADGIGSVGLTNVFSPKKRNNLMCSRSFRDATEISIQLPSDCPSKNKRPVTICLSQCNKTKKSPTTSPSLIALCTSPRSGQTSPSNGEGPTKINEFIFLGSQQDASSESTMKRCGITHVLNVTTNSPKSPHVSDSNFLRISVNDGYYDQLLPHFNEVFQFIDGTKQLGGLVLIHCVAGVSRSATLVIAYLMHRRRLSFNEAYRFVKQKRPNIAPNFNFLGQLMEFENYLRLQQRSHDLPNVNLLPSQAANGAFTSTSINETFCKTQEILPPEVANAFKCPQYQGQDNSSLLIVDSSRISPGEEFLNDLRCHCRTNSNQSNSSLSSMGSHESAEILQVS